MTLLHEDIEQPRRAHVQRPRMIYLALLLLLFLLLLLSIWWVRREAAHPLERYGVAPTFTLMDQFERPVSSDALRGNVVVANFIYTTCTDICPTLSGQMLALQKRLQQEQLLGTEVHLLTFTVDPTRDTPSVLRTYAERFGADPAAWRFLTGPAAVVKPLIVDGFHLGVQVLRNPDRSHQHEGTDAHDSYEVMHSGRFVLIDREGNIRAYYDGREFDLDQVLGDIYRVLG